MHDTAMQIGETFFRNYLGEQTAGKILDLGGLNVNGSLREVAPRGWNYISVDSSSGPGVDVVLDDACRLPFATNEFDAVVSSSCFEHNPLFWLTLNEMCRVTHEGGYIYINAPSNGAYHRYPKDCWRFYPDAGAALVEWARRSGHAVTLCESFVAVAGKDRWNDFVCVLRKGTSEDHRSPRPLHHMVDCTNICVGSSDHVQLFSAHFQDMKELDMADKQIKELTRRLKKISKKNERLTRQNYQLAVQITELEATRGPFRRLAASLAAICRTYLRSTAKKVFGHRLLAPEGVNIALER